MLEHNRKNPLDYSSDEESSNSQTTEPPKETTLNTTSEQPKVDTPQLLDQDKDYGDCTMESDVTKQADELEKNLDAAMAQLQADETTDNDQDVLDDLMILLKLYMCIHIYIYVHVPLQKVKKKSGFLCIITILRIPNSLFGIS